MRSPVGVAVIWALCVGAQADSTLSALAMAGKKATIAPAWRFAVYNKWLYDSEILHSGKTGGQSTGGVILGFDARYQSSRRRPAIQVDYEIAQPHYFNQTELNRTMQSGSLTLTGRPLRRTSLSWTAGFALNNFLEDRALSDDYKAGVKATYRIAPKDTFSLGGTYKERYFWDGRHDSVSTTVAAVLSHDLDSKSSLDFGYSREVSNASISKFDFTRNGYSVGYSLDAGRRDTLRAKIRLRERADNRQVKGPLRIKDYRASHQWDFSFEWTHDMRHGMEMDVEYSYSNRASNDLRRDYANHQLILELRAKF